MSRTTLASRALDAVFPRRCFGCRAFGAYLCEDCLMSSPRAVGDRCNRCWGMRSGGWCRNCDRFDPSVAAMRSSFSYSGISRNAVLALKFDGVSAAAGEMAAQMALALTEWGPPVDVLAPVPLGWLRKRMRGYNQSELLAREVARIAGLPLETRALRRARQTHPQTRQPDEESRRRNVRDAFAAGSRLASGSVLLIDDVTTTGATLDACARVLLGNGADRVFALTFARED